MVERALVERLGQQLRQPAARVVDRLAHLDRFAAVRAGIEQKRATACIDLDLKGDVEFAAIAQHRLMMARQPSGA